MSLESQDGGAAPDQVPSGESQVQETQTTQVDGVNEGRNYVSHESHKRLLGEKKKLQSKYAEASERLNVMEQEKLEEQGRDKELIAKLKEQLAEERKKRQEQVGGFVFSSVNAQVKAEADKLGCVDSEALTKLVDLEGLEVDQNTYQVDRDQLKYLMDKAKEERPWLFQKQPPKVATGTPSTPALQTDPNAEKNKMSAQELALELARLNSKT